MHSKLYVVKFDKDTIEDLDLLIADVDTDETRQRNGLDYIDELDDDQSEKQFEYLHTRLSNEFCDKLNVDNVNNSITFTLDNLKNYWNRKIDDVYKYLEENNSIDTFVRNFYNLKCLIDDDHPKYLSTWSFYLEGESEFFRSLVNKMIYEKLDSLTVTIYKIYDYHF
jgi:hypothetical protein